VSLTIDASVLVAARAPGEPGHEASRELVRRAIVAGVPLVLPTLAYVECVAAVARKTGDAGLAADAGTVLRSLSRVRWVALDEEHAAEAARVAAERRLRAADAVYVAVARLAGASLVTLDGEVALRAAPEVRCMAPDAWSAA
jgi:predicted nucleic acid-binding protein